MNTYESIRELVFDIFQLPMEGYRDMPTIDMLRTLCPLMPENEISFCVAVFDGFEGLFQLKEIAVKGGVQKEIELTGAPLMIMEPSFNIITNTMLGYISKPAFSTI